MSLDTPRRSEPARRVVRTAVTADALDVDEHARLVGDAAAGAVVTFAGVVRDHDHGRAVLDLEYTGHPSAADVLAAVVARVSAQEAVDAVAVSHRLGHLAVGDCALAVAVSAAHRAEAFAACARLVDEVKEHLPVWKRQRFADGTSEWVACP
ncbi:molybdenum cofactor biosynthesis protein MoaE [Kineococcus terrestris]|uniref:molybdenum cofactor biosynthesis protein MoaE n=1 Tax=Kineococcus terrestris TaxID=2044856 RepID=UPI003F68B0EA